MAWLPFIGRWLEERAGLNAAITPVLDHPVPRRSASWWYTFGSATLALFVLQIATGICLALVYVPSADKAYESLLYLNYEAPFGWFLRAAHFWGSNAMVAVMTLHMIQVFLWGAHKYPREMTWVVGVLLFLCTLGMAFSGQIMRWDQDAYWGLGIGASIAARTPFIGESVVPFILGGPIIAGRTLSRVFTAHVFLIPGILIALVGLHLWFVLRLGVNEWPMPGRLVDRETYRQRYEEDVHKDGVPFFPDAARKDMVSMGWPSCSCCSAPPSLGPLVPMACRTRRSSIPRRSPTSTSWPSSRSSRSCRRGPRPCFWCSGRRSPSCCSWPCRSWPAPGRRAGNGGRWRCWA